MAKYQLEALRKIILLLGASGFLSTQLWLQDFDWIGAGGNSFALALVLAVWAGLLLVMVGPWIWRGAGEDERSSLTRHRAFFLGYSAMIAVGAAMFLLAVTGRVEAPEAIHLTLAVGVAVPMFGFAILD